MTKKESAVPAVDETADAEAIKPYYELVCARIDTTDDISFKLLGLVPVMSGTGVFLLAFQGGTLGPVATVLIALIGLAVTVGIAVWERRNIIHCVSLINLAMELEKRLPVRQFRASAEAPRFWGIRLTKRLAELIIYVASALAWLVPLLQLAERSS